MPTSTQQPPAPRRRALTATEIVTHMAPLAGWTLSGDGTDIAIEKTFTFANYYATMAFVNAVAYIAHTLDHHPDLMVRYGSCTVRLNTHDVQGLSVTDFTYATQIEALLS